MSWHIVDGAVTPEFAKMLLTLAEATSAKVTEEQYRTYAVLLGDIPLDRLRPAFRRVALTHKYPTLPTVGEIREQALPSEDDRAMLAWTAMCQAAESVGAYTSVDVEDGAAAHALLAVFGSWAAFCQTDEGPALAQKRQEFFVAYRMGARHYSDLPPQRLPGLLAPPPPEVAPRTWTALITAAGVVEIRRDRPLLAPVARKELGA